MALPRIDTIVRHKSIRQWARRITRAVRRRLGFDQFHKWFEAHGDETWRVQYALTRDSLVWDVGGYKGEWARQIVERYDPHVWIFEPIPQFAAQIRSQFQANPKVRVFCFGLGAATETVRMTQAENESSSFRGASETMVDVEIRDILAFLDQQQVAAVELIKINIEGGEYELLDRILDASAAARFGDIQVQFHNWYPHARKRRRAIRQRLQSTHALTYDFPFVWENWRARAQAVAAISR